MDQWTLKRCRYQDFEWSSLVGTQSCPHPPCFRLLDCAATLSEPQVVSINELQPACGTVAQISRELSAVAELCLGSVLLSTHTTKPHLSASRPDVPLPHRPRDERLPPRATNGDGYADRSRPRRSAAGGGALTCGTTRRGEKAILKQPTGSRSPAASRECGVEWCGDGAVWAGDGVGVLCREAQAHRQ